MKMGGLRAAGRAQYLSSGKKSVLKGSAVDDGWVASSGGGGGREAVSTADAWMSGRTDLPGRVRATDKRSVGCWLSGGGERHKKSQTTDKWLEESS